MRGWYEEVAFAEVIYHLCVLHANALPGRFCYERPAEVACVCIVTMNRGAREIVHALGHLPGGSEMRLMLAGTIRPAALKEELERIPGWSRVEFLGWQLRPEVAALLSRVQAGLVLYHPEHNHTEAQPHKFLECMSAGIPVIASDFSLWRRIVAECDLLVGPLERKAIASAIQWLLEHPEQVETMGRQCGRSITGARRPKNCWHSTGIY